MRSKTIILNRRSAWVLLGIFLFFSIFPISIYRIVSGRSLGLKSAAINSVYQARDIFKAVKDTNHVRSMSKGNSTDIIFLHHSVGHNLIAQTNLREKLTQMGYAFWDQDYNSPGLTKPDGTLAGYSYPVPGDNTNPDGLAALFSQPVYPLPINAFSGLLQHQVIMIKSCYPASNIESDQQLDQYKSYYRQIRAAMDQHPDKIFIILTTPPLNPAETNPANAARARQIADWLASSEFSNGHPNLYVFNLFNLLAEDNPAAPDDNMLRAAYRDGGDSHPNAVANQAVAPLLAEFIQRSIQQRPAILAP